MMRTTSFADIIAIMSTGLPWNNKPWNTMPGLLPSLRLMIVNEHKI